MTNLEMLKLPENTKVRIKQNIECAKEYKKTCLLSWFDFDKKGSTEINVDTGEIDIYYPFGIKTPTGICYFFPAECYELV